MESSPPVVFSNSKGTGHFSVEKAHNKMSATYSLTCDAQEPTVSSKAEVFATSLGTWHVLVNEVLFMALMRIKQPVS